MLWKKVALTFGLSLMMASPALAHEFVVKPDKLKAGKGETITSQFMAAHIFFMSDEMEDPKDVTAELWQGDQKVPIDIKANPKAEAKDLLGAVVMPDSKTAWLVGHRLPQLWSQTTDGMKAGGKAELKGDEVLYTNKYEKFAKVLLNSAADDQSYQKPLGQLLEIVPLANPATLKVGDELQVKILYDGKPIVAPVYASYDGFSGRENVYAYVIEAESPDEIFVKVTHPGLWVVRTAYNAPGDGEVKEHVVRSVLQFEVE